MHGGRRGCRRCPRDDIRDPAAGNPHGRDPYRPARPRPRRWTRPPVFRMRIRRLMRRERSRRGMTVAGQEGSGGLGRIVSSAAYGIVGGLGRAVGLVGKDAMIKGSQGCR